jgi:dihydrolipoamide dehydrogenase
MPEVPSTTDLAVIGAGPGGYAAAFLAAELGMQVCLIDPKTHPGGYLCMRGVFLPKR